MQVNCGHEWRFHFDTMHLKSQGSDTKGNVFSSAFVLDGMSWKLVLRFPWEDRIGSSLDVYLMSSDVDHVDAYFAVNIEFLHPLGRANNIKQGFRHLYTNDQPANVRDPLRASLSELQDRRNGLMHCDGSVRLHVKAVNLKPESLQQVPQTIDWQPPAANSGVSSLSKAPSAPDTSSLTIMARRAVKASLNVPRHIFQRQYLLYVPSRIKRDYWPCPAEAWTDFYTPAIMQQEIIWEAGNQWAYLNAAFKRFCALHWDYQHFKYPSDCGAAARWMYVTSKVEVADVGTVVPEARALWNKWNDTNASLGSLMAVPNHSQLGPGLEVTFTSQWPTQSQDLGAEGVLIEFLTMLEGGTYLMTSSVALYNQSLNIGTWGPFEQIQKWREFGRRGWLRPLSLSWLTDTSQAQIELWRNTLEACQHKFPYSEEFSHSCLEDCIHSPGGACLFRSSFGYNTTMLAGLAAMMVAWRWIMAGLSSSIPSLFEWHLEPSSDRRRLIQSLCTCHFVSLIVYTWAMQIVPVPWQRWAWGAWGLLVSSRQTSRTFTHIRAKSGKPPSTYASLLLVHHGLYVSCIVAGCDGLFFWLLSGIVAIAAVEGYLWSLSPIVKAAAWTFHVYRLWTALHLSATTALSYDASDDPHPDFGYIRSQMEVDIMSRCLPDILLLMTCMSSWKEAILDSVFMTRMD
ncbi:hypothetical protein WJX74_010272 [Apatococcus lobatus]|uniref:MATH domain-containing protein n=1 Tax=Apatococcus lobatus TaxID=904363 RepID=A0AAW1RFQ8_9CHLO